MSEFDADAVVVGSGPGGAAAADVLTAAGWDVVVLEKGRNHLVSTEPPYGLLDHFSNDEIKFGVRHFLGPDPLLEPRTYRRGQADGDHLMVGEVNNLPSTVGGGVVHADAKYPRFREEDFRLFSERGPVEGAAIADWPLTYDELEPFYAEAERRVGVAGEAGNNPYAAWRSGPFPMPSGPDMYGAVLSSAAAEQHGLHPYRVATGVNSMPYDGRPACVNCGFCGYYGCPIHAKSGSVGSLVRALRTGRCRLQPECYVTGVAVDGTGRRAQGVRYVDAEGEARQITARWVVLGAGAFETARLLLRSGVGNTSGLVGRHLMFHFQTFVVGGFPFGLHAHRGRSVTHHHDDHIVGDDGAPAAARDAGLPWIRGGTVEHGGGGGPIQEALNYGPGPGHADQMRSSMLRDRLWVFTMQGEDLPQPANRVDLDPTVVDVHGYAAGRVTYAPHRHELVASAHSAPTLEAVMKTMGAEWTAVATSPRGEDPPQSRHTLGTCRMGTDPATSVVDGFGRFHDVDNLLCVDGSVFVTSAGYNPTLTIVALALRSAGALV